MASVYGRVVNLTELVGWVFIVTSILGSGPAFGAEPSSGVRLAYTDRSSANCPAEDSLRAAAVERLGYDPFNALGRVAVSVTITRTARGLRGEIRVDDPAREVVSSRAIESSSGDCAELGKAMALAISIAVDAMGLSPKTPESTREDAPPPPPVRDPPTSSRATGDDPGDKHLIPPAMEPELQSEGSIASDAKGRRRPKPIPASDDEGNWQVGLHGLTSVGFTPDFTVGAALGVGWVGQYESVEIEGRADMPQSTDHGKGRISIWPLLFTIAPCVNVRGWAFCGLGRVGSLHGSGRGYDTDVSGSSLLATIGARLTNEAILTRRLRFRVVFDLDWLATNNNFDVDHRSAWVVSTWAVSLGLGITTRFP
jgi:hypothetical protein